jgi:hypothetical protein
MTFELMDRITAWTSLRTLSGWGRFEWRLDGYGAAIRWSHYGRNARETRTVEEARNRYTFPN